jgi:hypothetical protein
MIGIAIFRVLRSMAMWHLLLIEMPTSSSG